MPTIGRIVHYVEAQPGGGLATIPAIVTGYKAQDQSKPLTAVVLTVFGTMCTTSGVVSEFVQDYPAPGECAYPPRV